MAATLPAAPVYPRPPITVLTAELFQEPVYPDGEPYDSGDDDGE
ncbi:hypothetical protein ACGFZS_47155 [Streptomyces sp. NPDC048288]